MTKGQYFPPLLKHRFVSTHNISYFFILWLLKCIHNVAIQNIAIHNVAGDILSFFLKTNYDIVDFKVVLVVTL